MRALTLALFILALAANLPAAANEARGDAVSAFDRVCANSAAVANDSSLQAATARLQAEGDAVESEAGLRVQLPGASLQVRPTPERGAPGPWICQVVMHDADAQSLWRDWLLLRGIEGQARNGVTFIQHEGLSGVMIVERRDLGGNAVLSASPLGN